MKKTLVWLSLGTALLTGSAQADTVLGIYIGADGWNSAVEGGFADTSQLQTFNFEDKTQTSFYVALEHPIPLIPNLKLQQNKLEAAGSTTLNADFSFADTVFNAGTELHNQVDFSSTDYILYYEILDNDLVSIDLGVNAKHLDGDVMVAQASSDGQNATQNVSQFIPMLYSSVAVGLPLTGLELYAQGSFVSYDGSRLYDVQGGMAYALLDNQAVDLKLKAGYRAVNLRLDDIDDLYADVKFTGVYAGVELHF